MFRLRVPPKKCWRPLYKVSLGDSESESKGGDHHFGISPSPLMPGMEPNKLMSVSSTSGVRVFTVFVLSGSLFLLIYNIGRRRINSRNSSPYHGREKDTATAPTPAAIGNPNYHARGYFDHYKEKPLPFASNRRTSLTIALEGIGDGRRSSTGGDEASASNWAATMQADSSNPTNGGRNRMDGDFNHGRGDHDVDAFYHLVLGDNDTGTTAPTGSHNASHSPRLGHEKYMIEDMRHYGYFNNPRRRCSFGEPSNDRPESGSSILGDMSQLESRSGKTTGFNPRPHVPPLSLRQTSKSRASPERAQEDRDQEQSYSDRSDRQPVLTPLPVSTFSVKEMILKPILYILIWCVLSYSSDVYSTTGLGAKMTRFPAPFLKTTVQCLVQFVISICMLRWPRNKVLVMSWSKYVFIGISGAFVLPVATAVVFDQEHREPSVFLVALTVPIFNKPSGMLKQAYMMFSSIRDASLEAVWDARVKSKGYIPLCFFLFALAFRLENRSLSMVTSISIIAVGFILAVAKGKRLGLMESSAGPLLSGFRSAATQALLQVYLRALSLITPVVTMRALSTSVAVVAALCSLAFEPWTALHRTEFFDTPEHFLKFSGHIIVGALLATALALAELVVIYHTSALTVIILGMLKDLCVLVPSISRGNLSTQNTIGLVVFTIGLICLIWLKYQRLRDRNRPQSSSLSYEEDAHQLLIFSSLADNWPGLQLPRVSLPEWWPEIYPWTWPLISVPVDELFAAHVNPRVQQTIGFFVSTWESGVRVARKLRALKELAS